MTTPSFYLKTDDEFDSFIAKADSVLVKYENQKRYFCLKLLENWINFLNAEVGPEGAERKSQRVKNDSNSLTQFSIYWERLKEDQKKKFSKIPISSIEKYFKNNHLVQEVLNDLLEEGNIISFGCIFCSVRFDNEESWLAHINHDHFSGVNNWLSNLPKLLATEQLESILLLRMLETEQLEKVDDFLDEAQDLGIEAAIDSFLLKMRTSVYSAEFHLSSNSDSKITMEDSTLILDEPYIIELLLDSPVMDMQLRAWAVFKMVRELQKKRLGEIFTQECSDLKERYYKKREYGNSLKAWTDIRDICHEENLAREQNSGYNAKTYKSILSEMEVKDDRALMLKIIKTQLMDAKTDNDVTQIVTEHINDLRLKVYKIDAILMSTVHGIRNSIEKLKIRSIRDHGVIIAPILSIFLRAQLQEFAGI